MPPTAGTGTTPHFVLVENPPVGSLGEQFGQRE